MRNPTRHLKKATLDSSATRLSGGVKAKGRAIIMATTTTTPLPAVDSGAYGDTGMAEGLQSPGERLRALVRPRCFRPPAALTTSSALDCVLQGTQDAILRNTFVL